MFLRVIGGDPGDGGRPEEVGSANREWKWDTGSGEKAVARRCGAHLCISARLSCSECEATCRRWCGGARPNSEECGAQLRMARAMNSPMKTAVLNGPREGAVGKIDVSATRSPDTP